MDAGSRAELCLQVCDQPSTAAGNVTLLAFAADRRPCSNPSMSPAGPTAAKTLHALAAIDIWDRRTDTVPLHRPCHILCEAQRHEYHLNMSTNLEIKQQQNCTQFTLNTMIEDVNSAFSPDKSALKLHCEKKQDTILLSVTSPNVNRLSKFFHC